MKSSTDLVTGIVKNRVKYTLQQTLIQIIINLFKQKLLAMNLSEFRF